MLGKQIYQQPLFVSLDMDSLVPGNHLLRKVNEVIDFSFIHDLTKDLYSANGRPSIDPGLFLRMTFISYLYGIVSDRQLCEEVGFNLAYRWFCGLAIDDRVPDHSSLTRIRERLGEKIFQQIFTKVVQLCIDKGLVKGTTLITDATLIMANASGEAMAFRDGMEPANEQDRGKRFKPSNLTHVSTTDPDATFAVKANSRPGLKYKAHTSIDADSRVILDCHVTTGSTHDSTPYLERIDAIAAQFPEIKIENAVADRAYGSGEILTELNAREIEHYIPLFHRQTGKARRTEGFTYDPVKDSFSCPAGKPLQPTNSLSKGHRIYKARVKDCSPCQLKEQCLTPSSQARALSRSEYQELYDEVIARSKTPEFRQMAKERSWKIEGINAEAKNNHGLDRARYRGMAKVQIQAFMTAVIQNVKRLICFFERGLDAAQALLAVQALYYAFIALWCAIFITESRRFVFAGR